MYLLRPNLLLVTFCIVLLFSFQQVAFTSETTNNCHCFHNRTFNPADKFASDDYLLTTTFNSLLASEFNISKRQIIMMKMREGVSNNDLITALYISKKSGAKVTQLLQSKKEQSWSNVIELMPSSTNALKTNNQFNFILSSTSENQIAEHIINLMISDRFSPSSITVKSLKEMNLNSREIILSLTLASQSDVPATMIADQYLKNGLSWSEIAHNFGKQPSDVGKIFEINKTDKK